ncbi:ATP-dependent DNA helicase RecQ [Lewinella sp. W8]|uniref:RecQ family ATP-dependent DNA helicase n=1 Tax=Lewinella sp. W8 TaxID=2528208 RepID=UPI001067FBAF|nr:ATP-dependent DNA helicase RecQ [Lewinella sp. W8]MTB53112.1 RecQ family ATP-dependent DNA helicase [Lewinella sp. W8]
MTPEEILQKYWGYPSFRPGQKEIIQSVLEGKDTLALLPTGGGKSLCFQVPALAREGVTIVVSPLIALMKDQVRQLRDRGIIAEAIYSGMRPADIDRVLDNAVYGNTKLLYLSPERLTTDLARVRIQKMKVALLAVDEAHCISQWGYDFRPPYLRIAEIRELLPGVPTIAVTATATPEVVRDIQEKLAFTANRLVYQQSFGRENLAYVVRRPEAKETQLLRVLSGVSGSSIVYVRSRGMTKQLALQLRRRGIAAASYHAGLDPPEKDRRQEAWIRGDLRVIVATNAFGMGIDKANVRSVIHYGPPDSPEAYFQEAGRGGRDGQLSYAVMLYHPTDGERLKKQFELSFPEVSDIKRVYRALGSHFQLAVGGGKGTAYDFDIAAFSATFGFDVRQAYSALKALERAGFLLLTDAVYQPASLQFIVTKERLYDYQIKHRTTDKLIKSILRTSQGAFLNPVQLREGALANFLEISLEELQRTFQKMKAEGIIDYFPTKESPQLVFMEERIDADNLRFDVKQYHFLRDRARQRIETMITYAEMHSGCRSQRLLQFFGETDAPVCGLCDLCRSQRESASTPSPAEVLRMLRERLTNETGVDQEHLLREFRERGVRDIGEHLQRMLQEGVLLQENGTIRLP